MATGVDGRHCHILEEREFLHGEGFIQVLSLYIFPDSIVGDGSAVFFGGAEEHSGSMVILIIDDIHFVVTEVVLVFFLKFNISSLQHDYILICLLPDHLFFNLLLNLLLLQIFVESPFAEVVLQQKILLVLREVFRVVVVV